MVGLAFDENFNNDVLRGLLRRSPALDAVWVQDTGLASADDPTVLAWAATEGRVLVSHDVSTLTAFAYARVKAGQRMPGLIEAGPDVPLANTQYEYLLRRSALNFQTGSLR